MATSSGTSEAPESSGASRSEGVPSCGRLPGWVFAAGREPDPRFSLANERTFLAWIRTAIALIAVAVAVHAVSLPISDTIQFAISAVLLVAGIAIPPAAWIARGLTERAMRLDRPLPNTLIAEALLGAVLIAVAVLFAVGMYLE